jgi:uncharacterized protein YegL
MGKLMNIDDVTAMQTMSGYSYSGKDVGKLGATEYTLVSIQVDGSGSVSDFKADLEKALKSCVDACRKSPEAEKILVRLVIFNDGLVEVHGFVPLQDIDIDKYKGIISPSGMTALCDATLDSIEAVQHYAEHLTEMDFNCNGIVFVITDGCENASRIATNAKIKGFVKVVKKAEKLESIRTVLVGVGNETEVKAPLEQFQQECNLDQFIWVGEATPGKLAKLAEFISQSVSSQSKALGSGAASAPITF